MKRGVGIFYGPNRLGNKGTSNFRVILTIVQRYGVIGACDFLVNVNYQTWRLYIYLMRGKQLCRTTSINILHLSSINNMLIYFIYNIASTICISSICWGCRIQPTAAGEDLPLISILLMTLNHLTVRLQCWSFGEYGVLLHCHCSLVQSGCTWIGLLFGSNRTVWHLNWVQTHDLCSVELLEIDLFDHLTVCK